MCVCVGVAERHNRLVERSTNLEHLKSYERGDEPATQRGQERAEEEEEGGEEEEEEEEMNESITGEQ